MKKHRPSRSQPGFTLIELTVTLALLTMILAMCHAILFATIETKEQIEHLVQNGKVAQSVLGILTRDIEACYWYGQKNSFVGQDRREHDEMVITAFLPSAEDPTVKTLQKIRYVHQDSKLNPDQHTLFRGVSPAAIDDFQYQEIYDRIVSLNFEYYEGGEKWAKDWKKETPPPAVRIELVIRKKLRNPEENAEPATDTFTTIVTPHYGR